MVENRLKMTFDMPNGHDDEKDNNWKDLDNFISIDFYYFSIM